jgi:hypothetical protein
MNEFFNFTKWKPSKHENVPVVASNVPPLLANLNKVGLVGSGMDSAGGAAVDCKLGQIMFTENLE